MGAPREYVLTFAGAGSQPIQVKGKHLRVTEAPVDAVFVTLEDGSEIKRAAGQGINDAGDFGRGRLSIRSTVAQTVRIIVAEEEQPDNSANISVSVNATVAAGATIETASDVSIPATSAAIVLAGDPDTKAVTVTSLDTNTDVIRVGETGGVGATRGHPLYPGDSVTLATTATVRAYNTGAGAQSVAVLAVKA
jgi:hypothetical protein